MKITKKQIAGFIKAKLVSDPAWALHALEVVYHNQTLVEQNSQMTIEHNGIGFTGTDAEFLSSIYDNYKRYGRLTPKQMGFVHKMMPKYHNQIVRSSKDKGKFDSLVSMVASQVKG